MNKNTLIGLVLIGVILAGFTFYNQKALQERQAEEQATELTQQGNTEEAKPQQDYSLSEDKKDSLTTQAIEKDESANDSTITSVEGEQTIDEEVVTPKQVGFTDTKTFTEEQIVLENDNIEVVLSNKGGGVKSVYLKNHQTYDSYIKNRESGQIDKLQLFDEEESVNGLKFSILGNIFNTKNIAFEVEKSTPEYVSYVAKYESDGKEGVIKQIYSIQPGDYYIHYEIKIQGFEGLINQDNILIDWESDLIKTERLLTEQRRYSTIFYQETGGKYQYMSEMKDDELVAKTDMDWIAFKQSYFSSIMMPDRPFKKEGTYLKVSNFPEDSAKDSTHVKHYAANINPNFSNTADGSVQMKWFFGPNDYDLLKSYNNGTKDLLNYGWGLFRWMNIYLIQPVFDWLVGFGLNMGIAILVLTVILKLFLTPIQWKMYVSSAKMRILKPEIEEINKKYPEKDQAMEKQVEMMALYRETGSSPLAGCLPMLIQMPILVAVFRFFPSTFSLRQQSFLWAEDLSSYDSILDFNFNIPFYGDHISLFTLLMAGTTLIYTFINSANQMQQPSQPGMPNMKVIMYFMPIMMIFFFNNYSSGLSYYYFISTLMSILTMVAIKQFFVDEEKLKLKMQERKLNNQDDGKKKKKSKFQERLEEAQRIQQERLKQGKKK